MSNYICIHGHFYQPPRENPWLEMVELDDSASPYHDWNERVTAECYGPNAWSRILNERGLISKIVNNYSHISFNFGPTLLTWLKDEEKEIYQAILQADAESRKLYGEGSALAQIYNHIIMPLANSRDKRTQVIWGIRDFQARFGRLPVGMWLPETAVDIETLEIMAEQDIAFTILAPQQAKAVRSLQGGNWQDVSGGKIDTRQPYQVNLPSGKKISVFFFDKLIADEVSFGHLLDEGRAFAQRLLVALPSEEENDKLLHIATDGETFGHHHRFGDMALASCLETIKKSGKAQLTNYASFLSRNPPRWEVEIIENSSWSCPHGVERWRSNCGCNTGQHPGWSQAWRAPLRQGLDWLHDKVAPLYEELASKFLNDPWRARDEYIDIILDRSPQNVSNFLERFQFHPLSKGERITVLKLLELQRHLLLMYTSCGWFFDDISGVETVQILRYAGRAIQLVEELFGANLEEEFLGFLKEAPSNNPQFGNGSVLYERLVSTSRLNLSQVAAHFAINALFKRYEDSSNIACYNIDKLAFDDWEEGRAHLLTAKVRVSSQITEESASFNVAALHLGNHNLLAGALEEKDQSNYYTLRESLASSFARADFPETIRLFDQTFPATYSLRSLFLDEQRPILNLILEATLSDVEEEYRNIYIQNQSLMHFLSDLKVPIPKALLVAAERAYNADLRRSLSSAPPDLAKIHQLLEEADAWKLTLEEQELAYLIQGQLEEISMQFKDNPYDLHLLDILVGLIKITPRLAASVNTWRVQNYVYELLLTAYPQMLSKETGEGKRWVKSFQELCDILRIARD